MSLNCLTSDNKDDVLTECKESSFNVCNDNVSLYVCTWNLSGKTPNYSHLNELLPLNHTMYVIGTQECCHSIEKSVVYNCKMEWESLLKKYFNKNNYVCIKSVELVALHLIIFIKKEYYSYINNIESNTIGTGKFGFYGNKGATSIELTFNSLSLMFVNSHFHAHSHKIERRNNDYHKIHKNLIKKRYDILFWFGDLNYRIVKLTKHRVLNIINKKHYDRLIKHDQLLHYKTKTKNIFHGFSEDKIMFPPTYKYDTKTNTYTNKKQRIPSYTDRILYKCNLRGNTFKNISIKSTQYNCIQSLLLSDHKPVYNVFKICFNSG